MLVFEIHQLASGHMRDLLARKPHVGTRPAASRLRIEPHDRKIPERPTIEFLSRIGTLNDHPRRTPEVQRLLHSDPMIRAFHGLYMPITRPRKLADAVQPALAGVPR